MQWRRAAAMNRTASLFLVIFLFQVGDVSMHAQEASERDKALANGKSTSQKEPGTQTADGASTLRAGDQLIQLEKELARATLNHDRDFYDRILADDWINVHEDDSVGTKQGDAAHKSEYDTATFDDIKVRVYGESAVTVGHYSVGWTEGGRHSAVSGRFTDLWMKRNGRWQIVASQNTAIPKANAAEFPPILSSLRRKRKTGRPSRTRTKLRLRGCSLTTSWGCTTP